LKKANSGLIALIGFTENLMRVEFEEFAFHTYERRR
jgi:hypothetical protein